MNLNVNEMMIIEMIIIDHRYSDIREFYMDDHDRLKILRAMVKEVLDKAPHEATFQTFVNIELDKLVDHLKEYESLH